MDMHFGSPTMKVSDHDRAEFAETGLLRLPRFVSAANINAAREGLLAELTRLGLRAHGKWHTKRLAGQPPFQVTVKIAQGLRHVPACDDVIPSELVSLASSLAGAPLHAGPPHPQILVTPPQKEPWSIPTAGWHVDITARPDGGIPGVQVFVLLDDLAPRGGATLAIRGSHCVRDTQPSADTVIEMSGRAGDVYLMDMRILHAPSINAAKTARLMLTTRFLRSV
jgi:hypothetical protein